MARQAPEGRQIRGFQRSVQIRKQDQRLESRQSFIELVDDVIGSADIYADHVKTNESPMILATANKGMNLQIGICKQATIDHKREESDYDDETVKIAYANARKYQIKVQQDIAKHLARKKKVRTSDKQKRIEQALQIRELYADAICMILKDPHSVETPQRTRRVGPSAKELDEQVQSGAVQPAASLLVGASHGINARAKDVRENPQKYKEQHEKMAKGIDESADQKPEGFIRAEQFVFHIDPRLMIQRKSQAPDLQGQGEVSSGFLDGVKSFFSFGSKEPMDVDTPSGKKEKKGGSWW